MSKIKVEQLPLTFVGDEFPVPVLPQPHHHPEWITTSPTELRTTAHLLDLQEQGLPTLAQKNDLERMAVSSAAGTVMHNVAQLTELWTTCRPRSHGREEAQNEYHQRLDEFPKLLPTTKPAEVRRLRVLIDTPEFALPTDHHGSAQTECLEVMAQKLIAHARENPPLAESYPLGLQFTGPDNSPQFLNPDQLNKKWVDFLPQLEKRIKSVQQWQLAHHPIGAEMSKPTSGFIYGLTEISLALNFRELKLTLLKRADDLTRFENNGEIHVRETDLKSSAHVHTPETGSHEEAIEEALTYLTTIAMIEAHSLTQEKQGYHLVGHSNTSAWNPETTQPQDKISLKIIALGGEQPEIVDLAQKYERTLSDPIAAAETILKAEEIINLLRRQKGIPVVPEEK